MAKKIKKVKVEGVKVRAPSGKPDCPFHHIPMEYEPARGIWKCSTDGCKQIAFPPTQIDKGKPLIGSGALELLVVKDPGGNKSGRMLLRVAEQNLMIDITDHVVLRSDESTGGKRHTDVHIRLFNVMDTR